MNCSPTRCPTCPGRYYPIPFDGPSPSRILLMGERPGQTEERNALRDFTQFSDRRCFVGDAGREFNDHYLLLAGLDRDEVRVGNVVRCGEDQNKTPGKKDLSCGSFFLPEELDQTQPEIVILMGAVACSLVPEIDLTSDHGIPRWVEGFMGVWSCWIVPMYHPASGLHDSSMMIPMIEDWSLLKPWLETGEWQWVEDTSVRDYGLIKSVRDWEEYVSDCFLMELGAGGPLPLDLIGGDTESHDRIPYSFQLSLYPTTARMILLKDEWLVREVGGWLNARMGAWGNTKLVFHYAPADLPIFESIVGGSLNGEYRDTIQECYRFGNFHSQGLKPLSRRVLGRKRLSWEETVTPYSKEVLSQWMMQAFCHAESSWSESIPRFHKISGKSLKPLIVKSLPEKLLPELMGYVLKSPEYPIWQKISERMPSEWLEKLVAAVGPVPAKGIAHCPLDVQIEYACLSKETKIITEDGPKNIGELVRDKSEVRVLSTNDDQQLEYKRIVGWHRKVHDSRIKWMSVRTDISRPTRWGFEASRYTPDHRLLTEQGYKEIQELKPGDTILHPTKALNTIQLQIVLGSMLGDGTLGLRNPGGWAVLTFSNNERQLGYVQWKRECLSDLVDGEVIRRGNLKPRKIAGRWTQPSPFYGISTKAHPEIARLRHASYPTKGAKRVAGWIDELEPLGLAVWYMDDGTRVRNGENHQSARFYTNSYPKQDVEKLCDLLNSKFGYEPSMFQMNGDWVMALNERSSCIFFEQIAPYIPDCMQYKLPTYLRGRFKGIPQAYNNGLVWARVVRVYENPVNRRGSSLISYCIDVEDNHNFATFGEVAHNCSDPDDTLSLALEFERRRGEFVEKLAVVEEDWDR